MLDGIKAKLGFARANDQTIDQEPYDDYADSDYHDDYDEYGEDYSEYAEYGADYDANVGYESTGTQDEYDAYVPATTRPAHVGSTRRSSRSTSMPKLVSIEDVRARTQVPDSLNRDPLPPRHVSSASSSSFSRGTTYRGNRTMVDSSLPASLTPEGAAATASAAYGSSRRNRSEGLNSLFEPTDAGNDKDSSGSFDARNHESESVNRFSQGSSSYTAPSRVGDVASASADYDTSANASSRGGFDPYDAYSGAGSTVFSASRSLSVVKPASYGEAERIAKVLKAGDVVVLSLRNTPDSLSKRILDFSFGVASALDANVECISDKVFAITRGGALGDAERLSLRGQGVI